MQLTKTFSSEQYRDALEGWLWAGVEGKTPILTTLFGDVFLQDARGYWFLDSIQGSLTLQWESRDAIQATLDSPEGQDQYLLAGLAWAAEKRGLILESNEVYDFRMAPVFGGAIVADNVTKMDFVVSLNIAGQIHRQVKDLPSGTKISGVTVDRQGAIELTTE